MTDSSPPPVLPRLVLVDDEPDFRRLLRILLERDGFVIAAEAANGADGIDQVELHDPDLVLTDLQMPGSDGIELIRTVRERRPCLPIVMLTGFPGPGVMDRAFAAGVTAFLEKHDGVPRLPALLRDLLDEVSEGATTPNLTTGRTGTAAR